MNLQTPQSQQGSSTPLTLMDCVTESTPEAQDRFKALADIFWQQVNAIATEEPTAVGKTKESDRGVSALKGIIKTDIDPYLAALENLLVAADFSPSAQQHIGEEIDRAKRVLAAAPKCCWFAAAEWLERDWEGANQFLALGGPGMQVVGLIHLLQATDNQLKRLTGVSAGMSQWTPDLAESLLQPLIVSTGGGRYYLTYVIANLLVTSVSGMASILSGEESQPESTLLHPEARRIAAAMDNLWLDSDLAMVNLMATASSEGLEALAVAEARRVKTIKQVMLEAYKLAADAQQDAALATNEAIKVRKLYERQQTHVHELHVQLQVANRSAQARQQKQSTAKPDAGSDAEIKAAQSAQRLAESNAQVSRAEAAELRADVGELQAFLDLLMEAPSVISVATVRADNNIDVLKSKVVVVGGHERVHHKLRKALPNSTFLHPDRKATSEDFQGADLVLFCVNYCNHVLSWTAYQEVRKQQLRSGYSRHTNTDRIIADVRRLLNPNGIQEPLRRNSDG